MRTMSPASMLRTVMAAGNGPLDQRTSEPGGAIVRDWRQDVVGVSGIVVLLGVWLIISPFVLDYQADDASWNVILCGAVAVVVALWQTIRRVGTPAPAWTLIAIGVWLFASGFFLADSAQASWNAIGAGALLVFLGSVSAAATGRRGA